MVSSRRPQSTDVESQQPPPVERSSITTSMNIYHLTKERPPGLGAVSCVPHPLNQLRSQVTGQFVVSLRQHSKRSPPNVVPHMRSAPTSSPIHAAPGPRKRPYARRPVPRAAITWSVSRYLEPVAAADGRSTYRTRDLRF